jgi:hypothetical protein
MLTLRAPPDTVDTQMVNNKCKFDGDRMVIGPDVGAGEERPCIRHHPDHRITNGWVKPLKQGEPLNGAELLSVKYDSQVGDFEVESIYNPNREGTSAPMGTQAKTPHGPAMVASDEYRSGWDRIFGSKARVGSA